MRAVDSVVWVVVSEAACGGKDQGSTGVVKGPYKPVAKMPDGFAKGGTGGARYYEAQLKQAGIMMHKQVLPRNIIFGPFHASDASEDRCNPDRSKDRKSVV